MVGGHGLPPGVVGGPALLTGALSAIVVRQGAPLSVPDARVDERVAYLPAVTSGQVRAYLGSPLVAASGHVVGALTVYDPEPRSRTGPTTPELLAAAGRLRRAELELSLPAHRAVLGHPAERGARGQLLGIWEQDLRTGAIDWTSAARRSTDSTGRPTSTRRRTCRRGSRTATGRGHPP